MTRTTTTDYFFWPKQGKIDSRSIGAQRVSKAFWAPGKAIICGEHCVVYGGQALAFPLQGMGVEVTLFAIDSGGLESLDDAPASMILSTLLEDAFELIAKPAFPLRVKITSSLPMGCGLGSSAALSVAILRALSDMTGRALCIQDLDIAAKSLETRFHGRSSGLDTAVVTSERAISFVKDELVRPLCYPSKLSFDFVLVNSGESASTKEMVERARPFLEGQAGRQRVARMSAASRLAEEGLVEDDGKKMAAALGHAEEVLRHIGVLTERLESITATLKKHGALAAKVTGAGGGGCVLAMFGSRGFNHKFSELRRRLPFDIYHASLSGGFNEA